MNNQPDETPHPNIGDVKAEDGAVPDGKTLARIWMIVVSVFASVLLGSFVTLAIATFSSKTPDILLTAFTTSAGFLAGLLAQGPTGK